MPIMSQEMPCTPQQVPWGTQGIPCAASNGVAQIAKPLWHAQDDLPAPLPDGCTSPSRHMGAHALVCRSDGQVEQGSPVNSFVPAFGAAATQKPRAASPSAPSVHLRFAYHPGCEQWRLAGLDASSAELFSAVQGQLQQDVVCRPVDARTLHVPARAPSASPTLAPPVSTASPELRACPQRAAEHHWHAPPGANAHLGGACKSTKGCQVARHHIATAMTPVPQVTGAFTVPVCVVIGSLDTGCITRS
jgi:hypothetical protein